MTRIAIISDTHANLTAFETVLADIRSRGIERIIHLGDVAGKGPRGSACCDLARASCDLILRGNWDSFLGNPPASDAVAWWQQELGLQNLDWLGSLPFSTDIQLAGKNIRCYHASADSVFHRIWPNVSGDELEGMFANTEETGNGPIPDVIVYADIHYAYSRRMRDRLIINTGSVGNPMDEPTASYVILHDDAGEFRHEPIRVPYDIESELQAAARVNMPLLREWQQELRTAVYAR